jgi:hypothetical protein
MGSGKELRLFKFKVDETPTNPAKLLPQPLPLRVRQFDELG